MTRTQGMALTTREQCIEFIKNASDTRISYIAALLNSAQKVIDEFEDDLYCLALHEEYMNSSEKDEESVPLEDVAAKWGLSSHENYN